MSGSVDLTLCELEQVLLTHAARYPRLTPGDAVKLVFQSEYGGGHLIADPEIARLRLREEWSHLPPGPPQLRCEAIGNGLLRVHLQGLPETALQPLGEAFVRSAEQLRGNAACFAKKLNLLEDLAQHGALPFSQADLMVFLRTWHAQGEPLLSHSPAYRDAYGPAYRVVLRDCLPEPLPEAAQVQTALAVQTLGAAAAALREAGRPVLIAIDGRCASGKSTLAAALQARFGWAVVPMDDFFLRPEQRTPERYATPGGNIDHERFLSEVLLPLRAGRAPVYRPFDCHAGCLGAPKQIPATAVTVVEGSYSCHPALRGCYDLRLLLTISPERQLTRIAQREGTQSAAVFREKWIPLEERYFSGCAVAECCELHLCI